ncbi:hypothetical protein TcWFU_003368 [Taenia crassiceps]|uniref:Uncharacterized protein n=1 Tax=Taenia crassiceps TaxID=6207 RepID=A0ABR4Q113_9CEST
MDGKLIGLLCFFVSVITACVSKDEEVTLELVPAVSPTDKCPQVADLTKEMPQIVNHLVKNACTSMVPCLPRRRR